MSSFQEGMAIMEKWFGGGKDNLLSLATIDEKPGTSGRPRPVVRTVDAYYENGVFYAITYAKSNKILQIIANEEVAVASAQEMFTARGIGVNLGWVLAPCNAGIRAKLRDAFSEWYEMANNESDENCCILAVRLTTGIVNVNHWEKLYFMDFEHGCLRDV